MAKHRSGPGPDEPSPAQGGPAAPILDTLTGVYSIEYFEHQLRSQLAYALRHDRDLSVILIAVDYLDDMTETFGREAQGRILARVAELVREHVRDEDVLARYGRGELALLCRDTKLAAAGFLAKRLRQAVESAGVSHGGLELPVTVSVGVATIDPEVDEKTPMMERAEAALARARATGNTIVLSDAER